MIHKDGFLIGKVDPHIIAQRVQHVINADIRLIPRVHMDQNVSWRHNHQSSIINHQSSIIISKWICSQSSGATRAVGRWGDTRSRECRRSTRCTAASARAWFRAERSFRTRCASLRHRKGETGKRFKSRKVCKPFERRFTQAAQLLMNASLACEKAE